MSLESTINELLALKTEIKVLGPTNIDTPNVYSDTNTEVHFIGDDERVLAIVNAGVINELQNRGHVVPSFEKAGPRKKLFFEPSKTVSAVITCGGLCPGLNSVVRAIVLLNYFRYNNQITYGIRFGYAGLVKELGHEIELLRPGEVSGIHKLGGTILGSSRGHQNVALMVDRLADLGVNVLYTIGGDGTQKGAMGIINEIEKRGLKIAVVGIPKTIDNDINFIDKSFGVETAFSEACESIQSASLEAKGAYNGIGLVKLMGRESGFVAAKASLATGDVNFCVIPETDFDLDGEKGLLAAIEKRILRKNHAVIVVAEGAGQKYVTDSENIKHDPSGNVKMGDIGVYLKDKITEHFKNKNIPMAMRYIDPSYNIRSCAPTPNDSVFCFQLAQMAVHAGMSGKTGLVVGYLNGQFVHLPMEIATAKRKKIDLGSQLWLSVLESTGQPVSFKN